VPAQEMSITQPRIIVTGATVGAAVRAGVEGMA
jgi:hypothetical protein